MRMLTVAAGAALLILAAGPALAGDPRGGGHPGGGYPGGGGCGGGCGGGGHPGGGRPGGGNINVNVNANASAQAFAGASASSFLNARAYNVGGIRGGAVGGGTVYVGGGYSGDAGAHYGGPVYYNEAVHEGRACASAPFGYAVAGFGRDERRAPSCGGGGYYEDRDRGGRYGYSERHDSYAESRYESRESYEEYEAWEGGYAEVGYDGRDVYRDDRRDEAYDAREYDRGYMDGRGDCDCRPDGRDGRPYVPAPEPIYETPYVPEPEPVYERPYVPAPQPVYEAPMTPNEYYGIGREAPPPRQYYRQEPGERG